MFDAGLHTARSISGMLGAAEHSNDSITHRYALPCVCVTYANSFLAKYNRIRQNMSANTVKRYVRGCLYWHILRCVFEMLLQMAICPDVLLLRHCKSNTTLCILMLALIQPYSFYDDSSLCTCL